MQNTWHTYTAKWVESMHVRMQIDKQKCHQSPCYNLNNHFSNYWLPHVKNLFFSSPFSRSLSHTHIHTQAHGILRMLSSLEYLRVTVQFIMQSWTNGADLMLLTLAAGSSQMFCITVDLTQKINILWLILKIAWKITTVFVKMSFADYFCSG